MKYDIIPRGHGQPIFVAKLGGRCLDEIKQAFAAGRDIGTVLDIVGRPEAFGRGVVALVEQRIKRFQDEILVFLLLVTVLWSVCDEISCRWLWRERKACRPYL